MILYPKGGINVLKEIDGCTLFIHSENIQRSIYKKGSKAEAVERSGNKKLLSDKELKTSVRIEILRSLDIFFDSLDFEMWETVAAQGGDYVRVDYKGCAYYTCDSEIIADTKRYFDAVFSGGIEPAVLTFSSFDGGGPEYSFKTETKGIFTWYCSVRYNKENHEELCGAGYDIFYELYPLRKGSATARITSSSPICPEESFRLYVDVDENLDIKYELRDE